MSEVRSPKQCLAPQPRRQPPPKTPKSPHQFLIGNHYDGSGLSIVSAIAEQSTQPGEMMEASAYLKQNKGRLPFLIGK
jgi:hypothetical protein